MDVLITCKYEEDLIKNRGARVFTTIYVNFSDAQGQITLESVVVSGRNLNSSMLSCMSLLPARNIAKSEQSSHTPGGSHHRPYHFISWEERRIG